MTLFFKFAIEENSYTNPIRVKGAFGKLQISDIRE